jgi:hypothetical protein
MCRTCGQHFGERLWYLAGIHRIARRACGYYKNITALIVDYHHAQPMAASCLAHQRLLNSFTRKLHGMGVAGFRCCLSHRPADGADPPHVPTSQTGTRSPGCIGLNMIAPFVTGRLPTIQARSATGSEGNHSARRAQCLSSGGLAMDANVNWIVIAISTAEHRT